MLIYKKNVMLELRENGYTRTKLRKEKILPEGTMTKLCNNVPISIHSLDVICNLLKCQPGDILEWVPDDSAKE